MVIFTCIAFDQLNTKCVHIQLISRIHFFSVCLILAVRRECFLSVFRQKNMGVFPLVDFVWTSWWSEVKKLSLVETVSGFSLSNFTIAAIAVKGCVKSRNRNTYGHTDALFVHVRIFFVGKIEIASFAMIFKLLNKLKTLYLCKRSISFRSPVVT